MAQHGSVAIEETPGIAREEIPRKSDSPDARADIRRKAGEAAAIAKTTKKRKGSCGRPPATRASPRELSSPSDESSHSSSESKSSSESDAVEVQHASTMVEETSKKSDSPDTRADIKRWAVEAGERTPCTTRKKAELSAP